MRELALVSGRRRREEGGGREEEEMRGEGEGRRMAIFRFRNRGEVTVEQGRDRASGMEEGHVWQAKIRSLPNKKMKTISCLLVVSPLPPSPPTSSSFRSSTSCSRTRCS